MAPTGVACALVVASVAFTLGFACAVPFAAFAAAAATTLSRRMHFFSRLGLVCEPSRRLHRSRLSSDADTIVGALPFGAVAVRTTLAAQWANGSSLIFRCCRAHRVFAAASGLRGCAVVIRRRRGRHRNFTPSIVA